MTANAFIAGVLCVFLRLTNGVLKSLNLAGNWS